MTGEPRCYNTFLRYTAINKVIVCSMRLCNKLIIDNETVYCLCERFPLRKRVRYSSLLCFLHNCNAIIIIIIYFNKTVVINSSNSSFVNTTKSHKPSVIQLIAYFDLSTQSKAINIT